MIKSEAHVLVYSHISSNMPATKNMTVKRGDVVGYVGGKYIKKNGKYVMNGNTTGPHLHFEVIKDGKNIDPIEYLISLDNVKKNITTDDNE